MWRNFPEHFDPIFLSLGPVSVSWYGICFLSGAIVSLIFFRIFLNRFGRERLEIHISHDEFFTLSLTVFFGALVGARVGYAILYDASFFLAHPLSLISPFDRETGLWIGIAGMSVHGGILGGILAAFLFSRKYGKSFLSVLDALSCAAPVAIFFGRIGNFLAGELFGRTTDVSWGMVFPLSGDTALRHPSALYEAFGEGVILFCIVFFLARRRRTPGMLFAWTLGLYGFIRFFIEFFREPDRHIGFLFGFFSMGQALSVLTVTSALFLVGWIRLRKNDILSPHKGCCRT